MIVHRVSSSGYQVSEWSPEQVRELVYNVEALLKEAPQVEMPVEHEFAYGLYMRKITIPKGTAMTGRVHKQDDLQIVVSGEMSVLTEDGIKRVIGPATFKGKAGIKPFGIAHEDTVWITVHHTHLTDLEEIEDALFEQEESMFDFDSGLVKQEALLCPQLWQHQ
jgi:hypothetical protein